MFLSCAILLHSAGSSKQILQQWFDCLQLRSDVHYNCMPDLIRSLFATQDWQMVKPIYKSLAFLCAVLAMRT